MIASRIFIAAVLLAAVAAPASAKDGDVRKSGSCTGNSSIKIKLSEEDGRVETEAEVDQNRNGVRWKVVFRRNGDRIAKTHGTTRGPSGSFEVERTFSGSRGDRFAARAVSPSGEVCRVKATY